MNAQPFFVFQTSAELARLRFLGNHARQRVGAGSQPLEASPPIVFLAAFDVIDRLPADGYLYMFNSRVLFCADTARQMLSVRFSGQLGARPHRMRGPSFPRPHEPRLHSPNIVTGPTCQRPPKADSARRMLDRYR
jgi:hypothetical protein